MAELIAQVSSFEGIVAAVSQGADAVIFSYDYESAGMRLAGNEIYRDAEYCRVRDVKLYLSIELYPNDDAFLRAVEYARIGWQYGADAAVLSDTGLARAIRVAVPDMPLHAGKRYAVFTKENADIAAAIGFSRVYLPKEVTRAEILALAGEKIETAVMIHGDMCMAIDGTCSMSAFCGGAREDTGKCARPCRLQYQGVSGTTDYPLSLRDMAMLRHMKELTESGVVGFVINGIGRQPEYTALVTDVYNTFLGSMNEDDLPRLEEQFRRAYLGRKMTDAYYTDKKGGDMNDAADTNQTINPDYPRIKRNYSENEYARVPVDFVAAIKKNENVKLVARDRDGNAVTVTGDKPETEGAFPVRRSMVISRCRLTGGTPYYCTGVRTVIDKHVFYSAQEMSALVSEALRRLTEKRKTLPQRVVYTYSLPTGGGREDKPKITVSVLKPSQLSEELYALSPSVLYIPVEELRDRSEILLKFIKDRSISVCAVLPRVVKSDEVKQLTAMLRIVRRMGIDEAAVSDMSHALLCRRLGFKVRGDIGLNVHNSETMSIYGKMGLISAMVSPLVSLKHVSSMAKPIDTEIIGYGRVPVMYTENCIITNSTGLCYCENMQRLSASDGTAYSVYGGFGCRNTIYDGKKLFIADVNTSYESIGLWAIRLCFTTENAGECVKIIERYMDKGKYEPSIYSHGLYFGGAGLR